MYLCCSTLVFDPETVSGPLPESLKKIRELGFRSFDLAAIEGWRNVNPSFLLRDGGKWAGEFSQLAASLGLNTSSINCRFSAPLNDPAPAAFEICRREFMAVLGLVDDKCVLLTMEGPDSFAPDQRYTRVRWRVPITPAGVRRLSGWPRRSINAPLVYDFAPGEAAAITLEWRRDGDTVIGRDTAEVSVHVGLFVNGCFTPATVTAATLAHCRLLLGGSALELTLAGAVEAPLLVDSRLQAEQAWAGVIPAAGTAMALYPVILAPDRPLHFVMRLDPRAAAAEDLAAPEAAAIDRRLADGAREYTASRMRSTGEFTGAAEALAGLVGYSRTYDPKGTRRSRAGPGR